MTGFSLYFNGLEVPSHRKVLTELGVQHAGLSYWGLVKGGRIPKTKAYKVSERIDSSINVLLDAGGASVTKASLTIGELEDYAADYEAFVVDNLDDIAMVTEFDSLQLGPRWIEQQRRSFWAEVPQDKFLPVWHATSGYKELDRLAAEYERVAIPDAAVQSEHGLAMRVNTLVAKYGTSFHGLAVAKPDDLKAIKFSSASTQSWVSPMKYGETIVWDGNALKRYPVKYKDQARSRHKMLFTKAGFDAELIANDDPTEVARFTLWSFQQLEANVERRRPPGNNPFTVIDGGKSDVEDAEVSANSGSEGDSPFAELVHADADNTVVALRNSERPTVAPREPADRRYLPTAGFESKTEVSTAEDGSRVVDEKRLLRLSGATVRQCDTCYVSANCPAFKPQTECAFDLPVEIKTKEQLKAVLDATLEMQTARVMFGRYMEELSGGAPDPNLSQEMDRLFKMVKMLKDIEDNREFMRIQVEARSGGGVLSRLFGERAAQAQEIAPIEASKVITQLEQ